MRPLGSALIAKYICIFSSWNYSLYPGTYYPKCLLFHLHSRYNLSHAVQARQKANTTVTAKHKNAHKSRSPKWDPHARSCCCAVDSATTDFSENLKMNCLPSYLSRMCRHCLFRLRVLFLVPETVTCQDADAFSDSRHEVIRPALVPLNYCDVTGNISSGLLRNGR